MVNADYVAVFQDAYLEERAELLVELEGILEESGYEDDLDEIVEIVSVSNDGDEAAKQAEALINGCAKSLLNKLGIFIHEEYIPRYTKTIINLINTVLYDFEEVEEYEPLAEIILGNEPDHIKLALIVDFMHPMGVNELPVIISAVEGKLMSVMQSIITAKQLRDESYNQIDRVKAEKMANFIELFPHNHIVDLLDDSGYDLPLNILIEQVEIDPMQESDYPEAVAIAIAGLALAKTDSQVDAVNLIESIAELLIDDEYKPAALKITSASKDAIDLLYSNFEVIEDE